ncbi:MAG: hypothetical protein AAGE61_07555 [Pseudomonadota bacterium]
MASVFPYLLLPLSIGVMLGAMAITKKLANHYGLDAEVQRKSVHVVTGLFAISLPWILPEPLMVYILLGLSVVVMLVLRLPALSSGGLGDVVHGVKRKSWGDLMLVAAVATVFFIYQREGAPVLYILPLAVLTLSDSAAALAGSAYGRVKFTIEEGQKSIEGSAIFFMVTLILAMIALLLLSDMDRHKLVILAIMTAAFATVVEADSWRGFDNYFVPVGVLFLLAFHGDSSMLSLVLLAATFIAVIIAFNAYGKRFLGLSAHSARAYTAGIFMISAVADLQNVFLPLAALLAQTFARKMRPSTADHPDLDMLAMLATTSFVVLIGGLFMDMTAISFYNAMIAFMVIQLIILALPSKNLALKGATVLIAATALVVAVALVIALNGPAASWHRDFTLVLWFGLVLAGGIGLFRPGFYDDLRHAKIGAIAFFPALIAYFVEYQVVGGPS